MDIDKSSILEPISRDLIIEKFDTSLMKRLCEIWLSRETIYKCRHQVSNTIWHNFFKSELVLPLKITLEVNSFWKDGLNVR